MQDRTRKLAFALGALLVLQVLHSLDELRVDDTVSVAEALFSPAGILGLTGNVVALAAVVRGFSWGPALATATGVLVAVGFLIVHGIPTASERTAPYWGDGSADAIQWLGVLSIWAACAVVVTLARGRVSRVEASPT